MTDEELARRLDRFEAASLAIAAGIRGEDPAEQQRLLDQAREELVAGLTREEKKRLLLLVRERDPGQG
jgi:hypothetical protein